MAAVAIYEYTDDRGQVVRVKLSEADAKKLGAKKVGASEAPKTTAKTTAKKTTARTKKRTASNK